MHSRILCNVNQNLFYYIQQLTIFARKIFKYTDMGFLALVLVLVLFVLAILSPKIFPNKMLSDNQHDIDGVTEAEQSPQSQPGTRG